MGVEKEKSAVPSAKKKPKSDFNVYSGKVIKEAPKKRGPRKADSHASLGRARKPLTTEELERFLYNVVLGNVKDRFGFDASIEDRQKAAQKLLERHEKKAAVEKEDKEASDANKRIMEALASVVTKLDGDDK